jgi:hypothetical protein
MKKILQAFKKLFSKKPSDETIYICDPYKANGCSKDGCWYFAEGPCRCTRKRRYAKEDPKGHPVIATTLDIWNDEYWEKQIFGFTDSQKKQGL